MAIRVTEFAGSAEEVAEFLEIRRQYTSDPVDEGEDEGEDEGDDESDVKTGAELLAEVNAELIAVIADPAKNTPEAMEAIMFRHIERARASVMSPESRAEMERCIGELYKSLLLSERLSAKSQTLSGRGYSGIILPSPPQSKPYWCGHILAANPTKEGRPGYICTLCQWVPSVWQGDCKHPEAKHRPHRFGDGWDCLDCGFNQLPPPRSGSIGGCFGHDGPSAAERVAAMRTGYAAGRATQFGVPYAKQSTVGASDGPSQDDTATGEGMSLDPVMDAQEAKLDVETTEAARRLKPEECVHPAAARSQVMYGLICKLCGAENARSIDPSVP